MIPRNYMYALELVNSVQEKYKSDNFQIPKSGKLTVIDFKTKGKYTAINSDMNTNKTLKMKNNANLQKYLKKKYLFGEYTRIAFW